jgi:hypothetical protein
MVHHGEGELHSAGAGLLSSTIQLSPDQCSTKKDVCFLSLLGTAAACVGKVVRSIDDRSRKEHGAICHRNANELASSCCEHHAQNI